MNIKRYKLPYFIDRLEKGDHFSYSRYGDGEWRAILGDFGENCDGHKYFPEMGRQLSASLHTPYMHAIIPAVDREVGHWRVQKYLNKIGLPDKEWCDGNVFVNALCEGKLRPFVDALRGKKLIYVGPDYLSVFARDVLKACTVVIVPSVDCFLKNKRTNSLIRAVVASRKPDVIGFSASMAANCLIADLYPDIGQTTTMIDFGSVFDPFPTGGRRARRYQRVLDTDKLFRLNFGGNR